MFKQRLILAAICIFGSVGCAEIHEDTRTVATVTGGAIGAGLGAIVGSQTGNAGAGLAIGAAAGSGAGYLVGEGLAGSEERARASEELINRRAAVIKTQRKEIDGLRQIDRQDTASNRRDPAPYGRTQPSSIRNVSQAGMSASDPERRFKHLKGTESNTKSLQPLRERPAPQARTSDTGQSLRDRAEWYRNQPPQESAKDTAAQEPVRSLSERAPSETVARAQHPVDNEGCAEAEKEFYTGRGAVESADKLLSLRRAVRLCPTNLRFQLALAQAYRSANRKEDAIFQYKEVLSLDANNKEARQSLQELER